MRIIRFLFVLTSVFGIAQEYELNETDIILDDLFASDSLDVLQLFDDIKKQDYLYATVMYNDKTLFSGRDFGVEQYSFFPSVSYINANNFFVNISSGYFSEVNPQWDFVSYSTGYSIFIDNKKSVSITGIYSYSTFSQDVADLNNQRLMASISYRKKWFRNSISGGYLFGGLRASYLSNNSYISIDLYKTNEMDISIQPRLGLFWGNQTVSELVRIRPFQVAYVDTEYFQLLNTDVSLPIEFNFGSWDVELEYTFSMPNPLPGEEELENMVFFSITFGYLIGL